MEQPERIARERTINVGFQIDLTHCHVAVVNQEAGAVRLQADELAAQRSTDVPAFAFTPELPVYTEAKHFPIAGVIPLAGVGIELARTRLPPGGRRNHSDALMRPYMVILVAKAIEPVLL